MCVRLIVFVEQLADVLALFFARGGKGVRVIGGTEEQGEKRGKELTHDGKKCVVLGSCLTGDFCLLRATRVCFPSRWYS